MRAKRAAASVSTKERQKKFSGHMIKRLLLTEWEGRTGKYLALGQDARTSLRSVRTS